MNKSISLTDEQVDFLLSAEAVRASAKKVFSYMQNGDGYFKINEQKLQPTIEYVLQVIRKKYPDLNIPFHSRWGHFKAGGTNRVHELDQKLGLLSALEKCRVKLDLVITSVLLDAGAGAEWKYLEKSSGKTFTRSEGLGLASYYMFLNGKMSTDKKSLRAESLALKTITEKDIEEEFQVTSANPLLGVAGRSELLNNLAVALENKKYFKDGRPGNIIDYLSDKFGKTIPAPEILRAVLAGFGGIWPGRLSGNDRPLGDVWLHTKINELIVFHKLSQWMTYSLIEPIEEAGFNVIEVEKLTGLAEYRNGGLLIDAELITPRDLENLKKVWPPDSDFVIEWRALTIYFLDIIGEKVQKALGKTAQEFPLAKVLEGGTWWAGRMLAAEKRKNGDPPVLIKSDGTVF